MAWLNVKGIAHLSLDTGSKQQLTVEKNTFGHSMVLFCVSPFTAWAAA